MVEDGLGEGAVAARSKGQDVEVPSGRDAAGSVSPLLRWLPPLLWFRNLKALLYMVGSLVVMALIAWKVDYRALLMAPGAWYFANRWWRLHTHQDQVMLVEIRAQGQLFRHPHVPYEFMVPDSCLRIFFGPKRLYDDMRKFGVYQPILETPPNVVFLDYFDEVRNVGIFNEDPDFTNLGIIAQLNQTTARTLKRNGKKIKWIQDQKRRAVREAKAGRLSVEDLQAILIELDDELEIIRASPMQKRSLAHYYQEKIPELKKQVMILVNGIQEYGYAIGAETAYRLFGQPMTPEVEQTIQLRMTKWSKIKMNIFDSFSFMPEYDEDDDVRKYGDKEMHELAQRAALATNRPVAMQTQRHDMPIV